MRRRLARTVVLALVASAFAVPGPASALSTSLVIGEVYGGGGNLLATYTHDYVELFNRGPSAVSLSGKTLSYGSATGTTWTSVALPAANVPGGGTYLVQLASNGAIGAPLPAPDLVGSTNMSATSGKVALFEGETQLDLVGYGTATSFETAPTAALTTATAAIRGDGGCTETDNNLLDLLVGTPEPENSSAPLGGSPWWPDLDADTYGDSSGSAVRSCYQPAGHASNNLDTDDTNPNINPGALEVCDPNNVDENSNGLADDADPGAAGRTTFYADADGDGYGNPALSVLRCDPLGAYTATNGDDPNDLDPNVPASPNVPPVITPIDDKTVYERQNVQFTVEASDLDNDVITWAMTPEGMASSFDTVSKTFSWTPTLQDAGVYNLTFTADDGTTQTDEAVTVTVLDVAATGTTLEVTKGTQKIKAAGAVSPADGHGGLPVNVRLQKRKGGKWTPVAKKSPLLTAAGAYSTSFPRPGAGTYRIVALFAGDVDHLASARRVRFGL